MNPSLEHRFHNPTLQSRYVLRYNINTFSPPPADHSVAHDPASIHYDPAAIHYDPAAIHYDPAAIHYDQREPPHAWKQDSAESPEYLEPHQLHSPEPQYHDNIAEYPHAEDRPYLPVGLNPDPVLNRFDASPPDPAMMRRLDKDFPRPLPEDDPWLDQDRTTRPIYNVAQPIYENDTPAVPPKPLMNAPYQMLQHGHGYPDLGTHHDQLPNRNRENAGEFGRRHPNTGGHDGPYLELKNPSGNYVLDNLPPEDYSVSSFPGRRANARAPPYESEYLHPSVWSQRAMDMSFHRKTTLNLLHPEEYSYKKWRDMQAQNNFELQDTSSTYERFMRAILNKLPGQSKNKAGDAAKAKENAKAEVKKQNFLTNEDILDAIVKQLPKKKACKKAKRKPCARLDSDSSQDLHNEPIGRYWRNDPSDRLPSTLDPRYPIIHEGKRKKHRLSGIKAFLQRHCANTKLCKLIILLVVIITVALIAYGSVLARRRSAKPFDLPVDTTVAFEDPTTSSSPEYTMSISSSSLSSATTKTLQ